MYDPVSGIEAYVRSYETVEPYQEYQPPRDSPLYHRRSNERYIEAVTDERFEIVIVLHPEFDFKKHPNVHVDYGLDGSSLAFQAYLDAKTRKPGKCMDKVVTYVDSLEDDEWKSIGFTFGAVNPDENLDLTQDQVANELSRRGIITITVQRGKVDIYPVTPGNFKDFRKELSMETTKKVMMEHGKSHSLKTIVEENAECVPENWSFKPARGKAGEEIVFTFFYTSRMFLEVKKMIPELPQPASSGPPESSTADGESLPSTTKRPLLSKTQIEVIDLEDDEEAPPAKKIKTEPVEVVSAPSAPSASSNFTSVAQTVGIKAEPRDEKIDPLVNIRTPSESQGMTSDANQNEKAKKKRRLMLRLEEIEIKKQLMELDEEDTN